ncbi:MAG: hypothetical protein K6F52_00090, partial [Clostridia bacterium]|nr:hypothetical protein [Clostridia bacterium]
KTMAEYSRFVQIAREEIKKGPDREAAMRAALLRCKTEEILPDFLDKHGTEVFGMLFDVVTKEEYGKLLEESGYEKGIEEGIAKGRAEGERNAMSKVVHEMKASGFDNDTIVKITGIKEEELAKL